MQTPNLSSSFGIGFQEGYEIAKETFSGSGILELGNLVKELETLKQSMVIDAIDEITAMTRKVCSNILRKHLKATPEDVVNVLREPLKENAGKSLTIITHPSITMIIKKHLSSTTCKVVGDNNIEPGDFRLQIEQAVISLDQIVNQTLKTMKA